MAGGFGTRIREIDNTVPKPLIKIAGVPILQRQLDVLSKNGIKDVIIVVSYMADKIMNYFKSAYRDIKIGYYVEKEPLGSGGALFKIEKFDDDFFLINGDLVFDMDLKRMMEFHKKHKALVTLAVHPNNHPYDSSVLVMDNNNRIVKWYDKSEQKPRYYQNLVNAGIHIINPKILETKPSKEKLNLDKDILSKLVNDALLGYKTTEYIKDAGTPDRFYKIESDIKKGKVEARNINNKQKAIFLDRDGTINKHVGFITRPEQLELIDSAAKAIKIINEAGYLAILITNQPVIARGEVTHEGLREIHNKLETLLGEEGAYLDAIYYCPHHPDCGFEGEIKELKIDCDCRKPKPGMILKAAEDYNIDLKESWMIGDSVADVLCGERAGCKIGFIGEETRDVNIEGKDLLSIINAIFE